MAFPIPQYKKDLIRKDFLGERLPSDILSNRLGISKSTLNKQRRCLEAIKTHYPDKLTDFNFTLLQSSVLKHKPKLDQYTRLCLVAQQLIDEHQSTSRIKLRIIYAAYRKLCPNGYKYQYFYTNFKKWRHENGICNHYHLRIKEISQVDLTTLSYWRKNATETSKWKRSVLILDSFQGKPLKDICSRIEITMQTALKWLEDFKTGGMAALERKYPTRTDGFEQKLKTKQDNLVKILHQSPRIHGINRTSWRIQDIADVYGKIHNQKISRTAVHHNLIKAGFRFKISREVLTSPDPKFREKLDYIKSILRNLKPNESFFSVDEYGHFSVKLKGGRQFTEKDKFVSIPQLQKSKGFLIVTAALELSTNQITHFYSRKKNTEEMIKLLDVLIKQYKGQNTLYISWDGAAWHSSKLLKNRIEELNSDTYIAKHHNPIIKLAPLPFSAQFLNVIESVFSGLAKAVIHNSNYDSLEECQKAIDLHFFERNKHFRKNPKQAGKLIWGKEAVKSVFDEANHCNVKK